MKKEPPTGRPIGSHERGYKIGRGKPPKEYSWKATQSGNKNGRPKGRKNRKTIVRAAERKTFTVKKAGRPRKMTITEIGLHNLQQDILRGDRKAFLEWLAIVERYGAHDETSVSMQELLADDQALLANFRARLMRKNSQSEGEE